MQDLKLTVNTLNPGSIMEKASGRAAGFRPRGKVATWLDYAEELGMNRSGLINEVLEENLPDLQQKIESRKKSLRDLLKSPAPA